MWNSCQNCLSLGSLKPRSLPLGGTAAPGEKAANGAQSFRGRQTSHASKRLALLRRILASFWRVHAALPRRSTVPNPADAEDTARPRPDRDVNRQTRPQQPLLSSCVFVCAAAERILTLVQALHHQVPTHENHFEIAQIFFFLNSQLSTHFLFTTFISSVHWKSVKTMTFNHSTVLTYFSFSHNLSLLSIKDMLQASRYGESMTGLILALTVFDSWKLTVSERQGKTQMIIRRVGRGERSVSTGNQSKEI